MEVRTSVDERDHSFLERCVHLAEEALDAGDEPFGSLLVDPTGAVLFADRNRVGDGNGTRHPELAVAQWAAAHVPREIRCGLTVYTSGEHCPMCAAAHGWAELGRIVIATSTPQLVSWRAELGLPPGPVAPLRVTDVLPGARVDGPVPALAAPVRALHIRHHDKLGGGLHPPVS